MAIKLTQQEAERKIKEMYDNEYTLISNYKKTNDYVTLRHICGEEYKVKFKEFTSGRGGRCPKCNLKKAHSTKKLTKERIQELLPDGIECLSDTVRSHSNILLKCHNCQSTFSFWANDIVIGRFVGCPECRENKRGIHQKIDDYLATALKECADGEEYEWLEPFVNSHFPTLIRHKKCGHEYRVGPTYFRNGERNRCPVCSRKRSKEEIELFNFVKSLFPDAYPSDRKAIYPYEIDIFIPSENLGIEFNGAFWHRVENKGADYHQKKSLLAIEKGLSLLHIFDFEWHLEKDKIKQFIEKIKRKEYKDEILENGECDLGKFLYCHSDLIKKGYKIEKIIPPKEEIGNTKEPNIYSKKSTFHIADAGRIILKK